MVIDTHSLFQTQNIIETHNLIKQMYIKYTDRYKRVSEYTVPSVLLHNLLDRYPSNIHQTYNCLMFDTIPLIDSYKSLLNTPVKLCFISGRSNVYKQLNDKKKNIQDKYNRTINQSKFVSYLNVKTPTIPSTVYPGGLFCDTCGDHTPSIFTDEHELCNVCSTHKDNIVHQPSFNDMSHIRTNTRHNDHKKTYFMNCVKQFQGTENHVIDKSVYTRLIEKFKYYKLIDETGDTSKITIKHIQQLLHEEGLQKYVDSVNSIYQIITKKKPHDITYLEQQLYRDFDKFMEIHDEVYSSPRRKSINNQYVLYQLLKRHGYSCVEDDFSMLKTIDRRKECDEKCKVIFDELGWNHFPLF